MQNNSNIHYLISGVFFVKEKKPVFREKGRESESEATCINAIVEFSPCGFGFVQSLYLSQVECTGLTKSLQKVVSKNLLDRCIKATSDFS